MMLGMVLMLGTVLTLGLTGCSESGDDDGSSGKGSVAIRLRTQYVHATRATGDWADPTNTIEKIHDYKVVFVDGAGKVAAIATGNANGAEEHTFRYLLAPGTYTVYGFANFDGHTTLATDGNRAVSYDRLGITLGSAMPNVSTMKLATTNGWTENIPMTSRSGGQTVTEYPGKLFTGSSDMCITGRIYNMQSYTVANSGGGTKELLVILADKVTNGGIAPMIVVLDISSGSPAAVMSEPVMIDMTHYDKGAQTIKDGDTVIYEVSRFDDTIWTYLQTTDKGLRIDGKLYKIDNGKLIEDRSPV